MSQNSKKLKRKVRTSYIISTISIAMVLFLLGAVGYLIINAFVATERIKENMTIHVMLNNSSKEKDRNEVKAFLEKQKQVRSIKFVSKEDAANEFKEYAGDNFQAFLGQNPLPDAYEIKLNANSSDKQTAQSLETELMKLKAVDEVVYQRNVMEQVGSNVYKFLLILVLFGGTLLMIALILLNNTIRMSIYTKRYLISTMKLVGATRWFIMRPFIGASIMQGVYAALIGGLMFIGMVSGLQEALPDVRFISENIYIIIILAAMLAGGILISLIFTIFAVNKFITMRTSHIHMY